MTKKEMVTLILEDMFLKNPGKEKEITRRYRGFLTRLPKAELETVYKNRFDPLNK